MECNYAVKYDTVTADHIYIQLEASVTVRQEYWNDNNVNYKPSKQLIFTQQQTDLLFAKH